MALTIPTTNKKDFETESKRNNKQPIFDADNLPNQNAQEAMTYCLKQGVIGGMYGLTGSTVFSLFAHRYCKISLLL